MNNEKKHQTEWSKNKTINLIPFLTTLNAYGQSHMERPLTLYGPLHLHCNLNKKVKVNYYKTK